MTATNCFILNAYTVYQQLSYNIRWDDFSLVSMGFFQHYIKLVKLRYERMRAVDRTWIHQFLPSQSLSCLFQSARYATERRFWSRFWSGILWRTPAQPTCSLKTFLVSRRPVPDQVENSVLAPKNDLSTRSESPKYYFLTTFQQKYFLHERFMGLFSTEIILKISYPLL